MPGFDNKGQVVLKYNPTHLFAKNSDDLLLRWKIRDVLELWTWVLAFAHFDVSAP